MAPSEAKITADSLPKLLENDTRVKLAGVDVDGILRGKVVSKKKFLSVAEAGFGFCSVIFGWDMHDKTYMRELKISNAENGYRDMLAIPDLQSFRRIPWEHNIPFFLITFHDPDTKKPVCACPRGLLHGQLERLGSKGYSAMAGGTFLLLPPFAPRFLLLEYSPKMLTIPRSRVRILHIHNPRQLIVARPVPPAEPPPPITLLDRGHVWLLAHPTCTQQGVLL